jgi:hypothetical protein
MGDADDEGEDEEDDGERGWAALEGRAQGGEEEEEEEEDGEVDVTTPLPSLPDGALSTVYHTTTTSTAPAVAAAGRDSSSRRERRRRRGRRRQIRVQDGASHRYTVRERVALFLSLWPYTLPLVCMYLTFLWVWIGILGWGGWGLCICLRLTN